MSRRTDRIAEQLRSEIARVLSAEATDPRIRFVTLTRVDVAPDLSRAVVYWSAIETEGGESVERVGDGLQSAASFVRGRLAQVLPLRRIPELHFRFDPSLAQGDPLPPTSTFIGRNPTTDVRGLSYAEQWSVHLLTKACIFLLHPRL